MLPAGRHGEIVRVVRSAGLVSVGALAAELGVSPSTIRRDLRTLDAEGALRRVRGGAGQPADAAAGDRPDRPASGGEEPVPFAEVVGPANAGATADKARIAAAAARLVDDGAVVVLDIGTTTAALARVLRGRPITVITSSLAVVDELRDDRCVELIVLGGLLRRAYHSLVGGLTEQALATVRAHTLFLGTSGVGRDGVVLDSTSVEVPVKRAMIACAQRSVLLADAGKFPGTGVAPVCGPEAVHVLVTSTGADPDTLAVCAAAGTEVRVA